MRCLLAKQLDLWLFVLVNGLARLARQGLGANGGNDAAACCNRPTPAVRRSPLNPLASGHSQLLVAHHIAYASSAAVGQQQSLTTDS
jgi:hypothetical protein